MKIVFGFLAFFGLIALGWGLEYVGVVHDSIFSPMHENVKYQTVLASRAWNEGTIRELNVHRMEYLRTTNPEERAAIAAWVKNETASFDTNRLPYDLQAWIASLN